jgi:hypothetical protein
MPRQYTVTVKLLVEQLRPFDKHDFKASSGLVITTDLSVAGGSLHVEIPKSGDGEARFTVDASSEGDAVERTMSGLALACAALSLEIQRKNPNQHYGHVRLSWDPASFTVSPHDNWLTDAVGLRSTTSLKVESAPGWLAIAEADPRIATLLEGMYYAALAPTSDRAKLGAALAVIENVETRFADRTPKGTILTSKQADAVEKAALDALEKEGGSADASSRLRQHIRVFRSRTVMNRSVKLAYIFNEVLGVRNITFATQEIPIDKALIENIVEARNRLAHGAASRPPGGEHAVIGHDEFRKLTYKAILLAEAAIVSLLSGAGENSDPERSEDPAPKVSDDL